MNAFQLIAPFLGLMLLVFLGKTLLTYLDHRRIREYIADRGGTVTDISWSPFRSSAAGTDRNNVYTVIFEDSDGVTQTVDCSTSLMGGTFTTDRLEDPLAMNLQSAGLARAAKVRRLRREAKPPEP